CNKNVDYTKHTVTQSLTVANNHQKVDQIEETIDQYHLREYPTRYGYKTGNLLCKLNPLLAVITGPKGANWHRINPVKAVCLTECLIAVDKILIVLFGEFVGDFPQLEGDREMHLIMKSNCE